MNHATKFNPVQLAEDILLGNKIIFCANEFYGYESGYYKKWHEQRILKYIKDLLGSDYSSHKVNEVLCCLKMDCFKDPSAVTNYLYLNLLNGLFNVNTFEPKGHSPDVITTIQLKVIYNPDAVCSNWLKTLNEVFESDQKKIELLQEFFGLCLTTETKYEKVLFLLGDGANGKSVILYVLIQMLGDENYSAIPLEKLENNHYVANLFCKLANISSETNAKSAVYDSIVKQIVTGDPITADAKFKPPFTFRPFCKLVFALNNMPRVDDKTPAFFRRILILKFNKVFQETEQNKNLKFELIKEIDGIFLWSLQGLKRLRERGYFEIPLEMKSEIDDYRKDNNNVILFVEDKCELGVEYTEPKDELYRHYSEWCKENNYNPFAKKKFGKELKKLYPNIDGDERNSYKRLWRGIRKMLLQ